MEDQNIQLKHDIEALKERLEVLQLQLLTNKEDFECERKDRERAQGRVMELEEELKKYHNASVSSIAFSEFIVLPRE